MSDKLVQLYQKMADLTAPECAGVGPGSCKCPHSCCDEMQCQFTKDFALSQGVSLPEFPPNRKGAFYLSETGCTVAPHLRPICTVHTCNIGSLGFNPGDPVWTKKYFKLRNSIEKVEYKEKRW